MPISQEGENAKIPKRDFVPGGHYAKITKRERVQEGVIAKVFEGVIVLVGDYSRGCTCQALQEVENAKGAKMLGGRVSVSPQNDRQIFIFVKDRYVLGGKITKNGLKMVIYQM